MRLNDWMRDAMEYRDIDREAQRKAEEQIALEAAAKPQLIGMKLAGRCANGFERGRGHIYHVLPLEADNSGWGIALCGKKPGRRSAGWSGRTEANNATCPRCLKLLAKS